MTIVETDIVTELKNALHVKNEKTDRMAFRLGEIDFMGGGEIIGIANEKVGMTREAFNQLAGIVNMPAAYANRIPEDLLSYNMNYLLNARSDNYYSALIEDNVVKSFMPTTSPYVPGEDILSAIEEAFDGDYDLKYVKVGNDVTSFSILPHEYQNAIDGSNLFGGLSVKFSESWNISPSIDSYIWREICSNGMIDTLKSRKFRVKDASNDEVLHQIQDFARLSLQQIPILFDQYNALLTEAVNDYVRMISRICTENKISSKVRDRIVFWSTQDVFLDTISERRIKNMHDIVNLFTFVGSHDSELADDVRAMLMEIGGTLTMEHTDRCGSCGTTI